ncbi:MAG TPA: DEAD/DEAH box helicase, partial [Zunongwangia profunda]|nr:DEAD/DEAH box helicase [Zunongwangia profunda]
PVDWKQIFRSPDFYFENLLSDEEIEREFKYEMPPELRQQFANSDSVDFDVEAAYDDVIKRGLKSKAVLEWSMEQHVKMCVENSEDVFDARILAKELKDDISSRIKQYSYCISKSTKNYRDWLEEDYSRKLRMAINKEF